MDIWGKGITNIPLRTEDYRYTFFELDTKDLDKLREVLNVYEENGLNCYVHSLIRGYHFYNLNAIPKQDYYKIIRKIKHLNPACPLMTLRITSNKWKSEPRYWKDGAIRGIYSTYNPLYYFREWIEKQRIPLIERDYEVVTYPYERCPKCPSNENAKHIEYNGKMFICKIHNIQTIGRLKKK